MREKGKKSKRWKKLSTPAVAALKAWLAVHGGQRGAVFINFDTVHRTKTGKRLSGSGIYAMVRARGIEAGCSRPLRPHGMRHRALTNATRIAMQKGYSLEEVLQMSGHANIETLKRYLDKDRDVAADLSESIAIK